jgi:hypothetical protein
MKKGRDLKDSYSRNPTLVESLAWETYSCESRSYRS